AVEDCPVGGHVRTDHRICGRHTAGDRLNPGEIAGEGHTGRRDGTIPETNGDTRGQRREAQGVETTDAVDRPAEGAAGLELERVPPRAAGELLDSREAD